MKIVTWSRGMSRMSGILIWSYRLKEMTNSYVLHCFELQRILHFFATTCPIEMGFGSKCSIFTGQVIYIEKSKLIIADMWLIPLDRVTIVQLISRFVGTRLVSITYNTYHLLDHFYMKISILMLLKKPLLILMIFFFGESLVETQLQNKTIQKVTKVDTRSHSHKLTVYFHFQDSSRARKYSIVLRVLKSKGSLYNLKKWQNWKWETQNKETDKA